LASFSDLVKPESAIYELCRKNFLVFMAVEMGLEVRRPQKEWWSVLSTSENCVFEAHRDSGKSMALIRAYSIWKAKYYNRFVREILVLGADTDTAADNLEKIKMDLDSNPSLRFLIPKNKRSYNTSSKVKLSNGVVLRAKGFFSTLRGRHPQLILLDDVVNERNSSTAEGREKMLRYFMGTVFPMKDRGTGAMRQAGYKAQLVVVGTPQNEEDLYATLSKNKAFAFLRLPAILDVETKEVLWPERYSWDALMEIKRTVGSLMFAKEYMCEPVQDDTTIFPLSLFLPLFDDTISYLQSYDEGEETYLGVDFSIPGDLTGDFTAMITIKRDQDGLITLLNVCRKRFQTVGEQLDEIMKRVTAFNLVLGYLEANMFQQIYVKHFLDNTNLPLQGHVVTASGKNSWQTGLLSFIALFENRKVVFPYKTDSDKEITDMIVREFTGIVRKNGKLGNFRAHDDCVMALYHAVAASRQVRFDVSF